MALNENMNEEQDMPVPQEPVQQQEPVEQQEEVTLPQPLTKEEEEKILAGEIPEFPEGVPTELVEEVARGVEDVISKAITPQVEDSAQVIDIPSPVQEPGGIADAQAQEPRMGPETIFNNDGFEVYYTTDKKDIDVDYVFSDPKGKVSVIFNRGYVDDMVNSQGYVVGSNYLVRELIKMDRQLAEEKGIDFSFRNAYLGSMADLYIDAMKRLGKNVSKLNPNSQRFQMYAASKEGAREIDQALTFIYYHDKFNGEIPGNIKNKLELPEGRGRLDSRFAGLTDREYENMGPVGKIGYNIAVAGKTMADVALPFWGDITPEVVPDVAPVGEIIGTFAGYMVPFSAASKVMAAKNFLQAEKYGRIPGVLVRGAVAGVAADSYVFDSDEGTLGNVFAEFDSKLINNAFTTALAIDIDDPEWEAKAKIALEGVILGGALDATVSKLRKLKLGERIPGFFKKMEARLGGDGLPKTSGFTPELDKAILELKTQRQSLQEEADRVAKQLAETPGSGQPVEMLGAKLKEIKNNILELATVEDALAGKYTSGELSEEKLEAVKQFVENTKEVVDVRLDFQGSLVPVKEETLTRAEFVEELKKVRLEGRQQLPWSEYQNFLKRFEKGEFTLEQVQSVSQDVQFQFDDRLVQYANKLRSEDTPDQALVEDLVQMADILYKLDPKGQQNKLRLALAYDILEEMKLEPDARARQLVPADIETNVNTLKKLLVGELSDLEAKEILVNRARSNKASPDAIAKTLKKRGIDKVTDYLKKGKLRQLVDIAVDVRTNNILYSIGLPMLATVGGGLVRSFRTIEYGAGKGLQSVGGGIEAVAGKLGVRFREKTRLIDTTKKRIFNLEDELQDPLISGTAREESIEGGIKGFKRQLRDLDRTAGRVEKEIKILKKIEAATDEESLKKLLAEAEEMGLVVEDPRIRKEAQEAWEEVDKLRAADESAEKIDEAVRLAEDKTKFVPSENPPRISDLEDELAVLKDPTYRRVDVSAETIDNIFYTLSGGKIRLAGRDPEPKDFVRLIMGLLSASAPSRIDPSIAKKSESLLGAGLREGYNPKLGIDPAGLGRLGKLAQGIDNPVGRTFATTLVSILEFIPRKALGVIDEGLKTRDFTREFLMRIDENIKVLSPATEAVGVSTSQQREIAGIIKEAMLGALGSKDTGDALDLVEIIMERVKEVSVPYVAPGTRGRVLGDADVELEAITLEELKKLDLPEEVRDAIGETLSSLEKFTEERRIAAEQLPAIRKIVERTVEEAQQFARETTVTQDVPPMLEGLIKGMQRYAPTRAAAPFARATVNLGAMAFARTPVLNLLIKKERQALSGALGKIEQTRSLGKVFVGGGLWWVGNAFSDTDGDDKGVHLKVVDKGSWKEYSLMVPMSGGKFEDQLRASALRWYTNNSKIIARELEREGLPNTPENAVEYILDNLPEWEDRGGFVRLDLSRLGPFSTLVEAGMAIHEHTNKTPWEYMTEKEQERSPVWDIVTDVFNLINKQGYFDAATDFLELFTDADYAAEAYIKGWGADLISPGKGLFSTAGEPGQLDFRPSREEPKGAQKLFNQPVARWLGLTEHPSKLMKKRDFLGRVIDAPDRLGHTVGKKYDVDLITSEMEELGFVKRVPKPLSIPKFPDIDLRKFKLNPNLMTKEERKKMDTFLVAKDGQNAYEDFLIMSGSVNVTMSKYDPIKDSAINGLQEYFKSQEYKTLKDTILSLEEGYTRQEQATAEAAYKQIRSDINWWIGRGRDKASSVLNGYAHLYVNEDGESLAEVQDALTKSTRKGEMEVHRLRQEQRLKGLDALRSGGNK